MSTSELNKEQISVSLSLSDRLAETLAPLCDLSSQPIQMLTSALRLCAALCSRRTANVESFILAWGGLDHSISKREEHTLQQEWLQLLDQLVKIDPFWDPLTDRSLNEREVLISLCKAFYPLSKERCTSSSPFAALDSIASVYEFLLSAYPVSTQVTDLGLSEEVQGGHFSKVLGDLRRSSGSHYTPSRLCREVIQTALRPIESRLDGKNKSERFEALSNLSICDPAMGCGAFVIESIKWIAQELKACSEQSEQSCITIAAAQVYGIDIDPFAVEFAQFRVRELTLGKLNPSAQLRCGDALIGEAWSGPKRFTPSKNKRSNNPPVALQSEAFSWAQSFPEIDRRGGFDLIVGNPPFLGGRQCSAVLGTFYTERLNRDYPGSHKSSDLCAFFLRRSAELCHPQGAIGLITTNTIAQGSTRESGLAYLVKEGCSVFEAWRRRQWPSDASVKVSLIFLSPCSQEVEKRLNGDPVSHISSLLNANMIEESPPRLIENRARCLQGSIVLGMGFTFDDENSKATPLSEMRRLIAEDPRRAQLIKSYMGGRELNTDPHHQSHRYVIDFGVLNFEEAKAWPKLLQILKDKVSRSRLSHRNPAIRSYPWWRHWNPRTALYQSLKDRDYVLLTNAQAAAYLAFAFVPTDCVFANSLNVLPHSDMAEFAILQSRVHEQWAWLFASTLGDQIRYNPTDCYETFPFPKLSKVQHRRLSEVGEAYHRLRAEIMSDRHLRRVALDGSPPEGLTATYNRFHDPSCTLSAIEDLRRLHATLDREVLKSYGWGDLIVEYAWVDHFSHRLHPNTPNYAKEGEGLWRLSFPPSLRDQVLSRLYSLSKERAQT